MAGQTKQKELEFNTWGGRRKGAGRKPKGRSAGVSHRPRKRLYRSNPAHITLRVAPGIWNLRGHRIMAEIKKVFWQLRGYAGLRITQFSVQYDHIHMIVEGEGNESLAKALRVLCRALAIRINNSMKRRGQVFPDRYHLHVLESPREIENAIRYVRDNSRIHAQREGRHWSGIDRCAADPCSNAFLAGDRCLVVEPRTWLLRRAWGLPPLEPKAPLITPEPLAFPWGEGVTPRAESAKQLGLFAT